MQHSDGQCEHTLRLPDSFVACCALSDLRFSFVTMAQGSSENNSQSITHHLHVAFYVECSDRNRAPHPCVDLWVSCGPGVGCFELKGAWNRGLDVQSVNDAEHDEKVGTGAQSHGVPWTS